MKKGAGNEEISSITTEEEKWNIWQSLCWIARMFLIKCSVGVNAHEQWVHSQFHSND